MVESADLFDGVPVIEETSKPMGDEKNIGSAGTFRRTFICMSQWHARVVLRRVF